MTPLARMLLCSHAVAAVVLWPALATADNRIYVTGADTEMPTYSSEPQGKESVLYLSVGDPPARPAIRRVTVVAMGHTRTQNGWALGALDPSVEQLTKAAAATYRVPHALVKAVMHAESNFNPNARSPVGAIGLMQIMPPTGRRYGVHSDLAEPARNIDVGTRYLRDLLDLFGNDEQLAVAAYNAGEGAVMKHGRRIPPYAETQAYVPKVMQLYERYQRTLGAQ
jgi:soluble lytic murein transglycosylase-like protein